MSDKIEKTINTEYEKYILIGDYETALDIFVQNIGISRLTTKECIEKKENK